MSANPFDYQSIEPLTTSAELRSGSIFCRFTCPVTGRSVSASADLRPVPKSRELDADSATGVFGGLRRSLAAALSGVLGSSEHASAQVQVAKADFAEEPAPVDPDEEIRRYAITRAFRSVSSLFRWERENRRWVAVDAQQDTMTRFESQLAVHPVRGTSDMSTLLRMLVGIARADGEFDEEERRFLAPFAAAGGVSLDDIEQGELSTAEVQSVAPSRRKSVLMICWAAALADGVADSHERQTLDRFAKDLGISNEEADELRNSAQYYLLERTLEDVFSDFHMSVDEEDVVVRMGQKLGLPLAETQNAIQRFRKRRGFA